MKKISFFLFFILVMACMLNAQAKPRLAILPFTGGTGSDGETIAELFSFNEDIGRVFDRIPRTSSIDAIMREQQFQRSTGLTDSDTIARLGRQMNAQFVVAGHIHVLGTSKLVLITIIHVESLSQVAGDYKEYTNIDEIIGQIPSMASRITGATRINRNNLPTLAILPFAITSQGVNQSDAEVLAQLLATEVANSGRYSVLPRTSAVQTAMREQQIQRSGLTETENIQRIGRALNSQFVLAGNVRRLGQTNMFTGQILNVETGVMLTGNYENYTAVSDGLTKMASLSGKLTGASVPVPTAVASNTPAPATTTTTNSNSIISASAEWLPNIDDRSTARINFSRERIDGQDKDVMNLEINLSRGEAVWAGVINSNFEILQRLRNASGVRFKVLGDGKTWRLRFTTNETRSDSNSFGAEITTRNGRVMEINIPYSSLRQPSWGRRATFIKNNIADIGIERLSMHGAGTASIKIFDFEIY